MTDDERALCTTVAARHGIDARLLIALREAENGGPGREFGVLSVSAPTWAAQADVAARTIRHTLGRFARNMGTDWWDESRGAYADVFLRYFSHGGPGWDGYAPIGAANDPGHLNEHHYDNLARAYGAEAGRV